MKNHAAKLVLGLVIFLFGTALAYFTANYLKTTQIFDYWGALAIFACAYLVIGIAVAMIFPISLGLLFAADVLILNLLFEYYGDWSDAFKAAVIGGVLIILYLASALLLKDEHAAPAVGPVPPSPTV